MARSFKRNDECRYCGRQGVHLQGCAYSPDGIHEEVGDADHCVFCGSTQYGPSCLRPATEDNPKHMHRHGHGVGSDGKMHCVWCGKVMGPGGVKGPGCLFSPDGKHKA